MAEKIAEHHQANLSEQRRAQLMAEDIKKGFEEDEMKKRNRRQARQELDKSLLLQITSNDRKLDSRNHEISINQPIFRKMAKHKFKGNELEHFLK